MEHQRQEQTEERGMNSKPDAGEQQIYYFGYGSNMGAKSLKGRKILRDCEPDRENGGCVVVPYDTNLIRDGHLPDLIPAGGTTASKAKDGDGVAAATATSDPDTQLPKPTHRTVPAILRNYQLTFDLPGFPLAEPSWANIQRAENAETQGVLIEMTRKDFDEKIVATEHQAYQVIEVSCEVDVENNPVFSAYLGGKKRIPALTLHVPEPWKVRDLSWRTGACSLRRCRDRAARKKDEKPACCTEVENIKTGDAAGGPPGKEEATGTTASKKTKKDGKVVPTYIPPAERYLKLLQMGAEEQGLSKEYQEFLQQLPSLEDSTSGKIFGTCLRVFWGKIFCTALFLLVQGILLRTLRIPIKYSWAVLVYSIKTHPLFWVVMLCLRYCPKRFLYADNYGRGKDVTVCLSFPEFVEVRKNYEWQKVEMVEEDVGSVGAGMAGKKSQ